MCPPKLTPTWTAQFFLVPYFISVAVPDHFSICGLSPSLQLKTKDRENWSSVGKLCRQPRWWAAVDFCHCSAVENNEVMTLGWLSTPYCLNVHTESEYTAYTHCLPKKLWCWLEASMYYLSRRYVGCLQRQMEKSLSQGGFFYGAQLSL